MDLFFGTDATVIIDYEILELTPDLPLLVYNISGTIAFSFLCFASG
jgi:hypothetical protein